MDYYKKYDSTCKLGLGNEDKDISSKRIIEELFKNNNMDMNTIVYRKEEHGTVYGFITQITLTSFIREFGLGIIKQ